MSHQSVATETPEGKSVLVFEDDAVPAVDFAGRFLALMEQVPKTWDGIFLGYAPGHGRVEPLDRNLARLRGPLNTHAYAMRGKLIDDVISQQPHHWKKCHWDGMMASRSHLYEVYGPRDGTLVSQAVWTGKKDPSDNYKDLRRERA